MKFKYGDVVTIKTGFFAGLTGKCIDAYTKTHRYKDGEEIKMDTPVTSYTISINDVKTEPYEEEDNLEPIDYGVGAIMQAPVDNA